MKNKKRKIVIGLLIFYAVVFIGLIGRIAYTSNAYCNLCHGGNEEGKTFEQSAHNGIKCYDCHKPTKLYKSLIAPHFNLIKKRKLTNGELLNTDSKMSQTKIDSKLCQSCHKEGVIPMIAPLLGHVMSNDVHKKHVKSGLVCTTCHNRAGHMSKKEMAYPYVRKLMSGKEYQNYLQMRQGCWRCHNYKSTLKFRNNANPPKRCNTCHYDKRMPNFHKASAGKSWKQRHGKVARRDMSFCQNCHENKGIIGENTGIKTCYACHEVIVPHDIEVAVTGKNWDKVHYLQKNREACRRCHKDSAPEPQPNPKNEAKEPDFCQKCHHRKYAQQAANIGIDSTKLRWKKIHFRIVKEGGAQDCFKCHKVQFCSQCHVKGKKAAPGTGLIRFDKNYWSKDYDAWL